MSEMDIPPPPDVRACSGCYEPLDWVWRAADEHWYAIVRWREHPDPTVVKLHTCPLPSVPKHPYRLEFQSKATFERGSRKTRAVLAAIAKKHQTGDQ